MKQPDKHSEIEQCLVRVLASSVFTDADRMQSFLTYVVNESLAGRAKQIKGKTIAQDVYKRDPTEEGDPENVVRVDARRLRRTLAEYYESEGAKDPIRIHIDSGGYAPRFEKQTDEYTTQAGAALIFGRQNALRLAVAASLSVVLILAGLLAAQHWLKPRSLSPVSASTSEIKRSLERAALLDRSARSLQAANLAEQARRMVFPLFDIKQQRLATDIFRQVIELDPLLAEGYSGAAQTLGTLVVLSPPTEEKAALMDEAKSMAHKALSISPTDPWAQASAAWVAFSEGDYGRADKLSQRAASIAPDDGHVLDVRGLILLFTGRFEEALNVARYELRSEVALEGLGYRNVFAAASFHLGRYGDTLTAFDEAAEEGAPVSPPRLAYQSAALYLSGDIEAAEETASKLKRDWPEARIDDLLSAVFRDEQHVEMVLGPLRKSGWTTE